MCLLSNCHKKLRMPRCLSSVIARSSFLPKVRIQTFNTPFAGARYPTWVPSGEIWGSERSGFPNKTSRGISGVVSFSCAGRKAASMTIRLKRMGVRRQQRIDASHFRRHHSRVILNTQGGVRSEAFAESTTLKFSRRAAEADAPREHPHRDERLRRCDDGRKTKRAKLYAGSAARA